jgi:hypothetical protein
MDNSTKDTDPLISSRVHGIGDSVLTQSETPNLTSKDGKIKWSDD